MLIKEYGIYCARCKAFIRINSYEFDPPLKVAPQFFPPEGGEELTCRACGDVCVYRENDIVHRVVSQTLPKSLNGV